MSASDRTSRSWRIHVVRSTVVLMLMLFGADAARGQSNQDGRLSSDAIAPNTRIRVDVLTADGSPRVPLARFRRDRAQPVVGNFAGMEGDTVLLAVQPGAAPLRLPGTAIRDVHVSRGRPPRWRAAVRGAVAPALIGAAVSALTTSISRKDGDPSPAQAAATSAAWGAAWGATLGAWSPKERWQRVSLPGAAPLGGRALAGENRQEGVGGRVPR